MAKKTPQVRQEMLSPSGVKYTATSRSEITRLRARGYKVAPEEAAPVKAPDAAPAKPRPTKRD